MKQLTFTSAFFLLLLLQGCSTHLTDEKEISDTTILSSIQIDDEGRVLSYEWKEGNQTFVTLPQQ